MHLERKNAWSFEGHEKSILKLEFSFFGSIYDWKSASRWHSLSL